MSETLDTITVSREEHDLNARARNLLNTLLTNPKHARSVEDAIAEVNPQAKFPGRDAREAVIAPVMSELEKERKAREALEARLNERDEREAAAAQKRVEDSMVDRLDTVKKKRGLSDESMERVMARMREQNNPDVESAAAWVAETLPRTTPVVGHDFLPSTVDPYGLTSQDAAFEGLHKDPQQWQIKELRDIVRDPEFLALGNA